MRRMIVIWILMVASSLLLQAQETSEIENLLGFTGAISLEEMDADEYERLSSFIVKKLKINSSGRNRLRSSGLLTDYQIASLLDYRKRHGSVYSFVELAALDGFGTDFTMRLKPFISLKAPVEHGAEVNVVSNDVDLRGTVKWQDDTITCRYGYGMKYHIEIGERFDACLAVSRLLDYGISYPDIYSGYVSFDFRKLPLRIIAGKFNARFGQGLALWNGMTMSSLSSPPTFLKTSSGLSASSSFTGTSAFTGVAADLTTGRFSVSGFVAFPKRESPSFLPAVNMSWYGRKMKFSLTHYCELRVSEKSGILLTEDMKSSADIAACIDGVDVFAETAYDWVDTAVASLAGVRFPVSESLNLAVLARYYQPSYNPIYSGAVRSGSKCRNEHGISVAGKFVAGRSIAINGADGFGAYCKRLSGNLSCDFAYHPENQKYEKKDMRFKAVADIQFMMSSSFRLDIKITEKLRTVELRNRTDLRAALHYLSSLFSSCVRSDFAICNGLAFSVYAEGGYKGRNLSVYLREGIFLVDDWDSRIYVYERDIPGSFNVPALYGRGLWTAATASYRFSKWGRFHLRASYTCYPFMAEKKPGKAELKFQLSFRF